MSFGTLTDLVLHFAKNPYRIDQTGHPRKLRSINSVYDSFTRSSSSDLPTFPTQPSLVSAFGAKAIAALKARAAALLKRVPGVRFITEPSDHAKWAKVHSHAPVVIWASRTLGTLLATSTSR